MLIPTYKHDITSCVTTYASGDEFTDDVGICMSHSRTLMATRKWPNRGQVLIPPLLPRATQDTPRRTPPPITFPLSADHCLITLVQYNAIRAFLFNMAVLSLQDCVPEECARSLGIPILPPTPPEMIPPDLQPTLLQQRMAHPYWIQAIPFPVMRDNLILLAGQYSQDDLFYDLVDGLYHGFHDTGRRGFLVWKEPWRAEGWEVTEGFAKKWRFLLQGCTDAIAVTNQWRDMRGEDALVVEEDTGQQ